MYLTIELEEVFYMAKLGSHKRPAVVRVQEQERAREILAICKDYGWQVIIGIEPDKYEDITDVDKLLNPQEPIMSEFKVGRNDPCECGSGKKFKRCCLAAA
jgi:SWIM/SEC-C metal-binding protein